MLVGKLVAPHFELVAPHDSQTEMEAVLLSPHHTGWSNAINQFLSLTTNIGHLGRLS